METWEMIKELIENPKKQFETRDYFGNKSIVYNAKTFLIRTKEGKEEGTDVIVIKGFDGVIEPLTLNDFLKSRKWKELKRPVDFITAIKSGKEISVKCAIETYEGKGELREIHYRQLNEMLRTLAGFGDKKAADIILNGDWYIE